MLFGSELFEEYIGQLAMASMASLDILSEGDQIDTKKIIEKMRVNLSPSFLTYYTGMTFFGIKSFGIDHSMGFHELVTSYYECFLKSILLIPFLE